MKDENLVTIVIDKKRLETMAKRYDNRIADLHKLREQKCISLHGEWDLGYFEGRSGVFQDMLDAIEQTEEKQTGYIVSVSNPVPRKNDYNTLTTEQLY